MPPPDNLRYNSADLVLYTVNGLLNGMIRTWTARFSALLPGYDALWPTLTPDERERAARLVDPAVGRRFAVGRGFLRRTLADLLGIAPEAVRLSYGERGKPHLHAAHGSDWRFNLSHADDVLLLAACAGCEIGADVERVRPMVNMPTVARISFSEAERRALFALPPDDQLRAFYTCWTRKEAYIKAVGDGFALPLHDFSVTLRPDEAPRLLSATGDDVTRWTLHHLEPAEGYVAAVCVADAVFDS